MREPLLSVVIPVRNEHESIARCLAGLAGALRDEEHEVLIAYDSPDDPTLPAIERAPEKSRHLRLVQNTLGKGPSCAIRAGLAAARGDVVVVTMADLSDPPEAIVRMAKVLRAGADVVSGSRYMSGGHQEGGPPLKTFLSRAAGLSLAWVAGLATHDATTSFRGFSRRLLEEIPLESTTGFTFGLEATVRAHLRGLHVSEIPVTWTDRTTGTSNFQVGAWLGAYLHWYWLAMQGPALVWGLVAASVGLAMATGMSSSVVVICAAGLVAVIVVARRLRRRMLAWDGIVPAVWGVSAIVPADYVAPTVIASALGTALVVAVAWRAGATRH